MCWSLSDLSLSLSCLVRDAFKSPLVWNVSLSLPLLGLVVWSTGSTGLWASSGLLSSPLLSSPLLSLLWRSSSFLVRLVVSVFSPFLSSPLSSILGKAPLCRSRRQSCYGTQQRHLWNRPRLQSRTGSSVGLLKARLSGRDSLTKDCDQHLGAGMRPNSGTFSRSPGTRLGLLSLSTSSSLDGEGKPGGVWDSAVLQEAKKGARAKARALEQSSTPRKSRKGL